jgi:pilus assembly protein TadC
MIVVAVIVALLVIVGDARAIAAAAVVAAFAIAGPVASVGVAGAIVMVVAARRGSARRRLATDAEQDELVALDLIAIGVAGGASVSDAMAIARSVVGPDVGRDLARIARHRTAGIGGEPRGPGLRSMVSAVRRSEAMGTSLAPELAAIAVAVRSERDVAARERLARLPVKLLFPLALLTLPGFVLMTVGPVVLASLLRLTQG